MIKYIMADGPEEPPFCMSTKNTLCCSQTGSALWQVEHNNKDSHRFTCFKSVLSA
jgi:hypothetical protein